MFAEIFSITISVNPLSNLKVSLRAGRYPLVQLVVQLWWNPGKIWILWTNVPPYMDNLDDRSHMYG